MVLHSKPRCSSVSSNNRRSRIHSLDLFQPPARTGILQQGSFSVLSDRPPRRRKSLSYRTIDLINLFIAQNLAIAPKHSNEQAVVVDAFWYAGCRNENNTPHNRLHHIFQLWALKVIYVNHEIDDTYAAKIRYDWSSANVNRAQQNLRKRAYICLSLLVFASSLALAFAR